MTDSLNSRIEEIKYQYSRGLYSSPYPLGEGDFKIQNIIFKKVDVNKLTNELLKELDDNIQIDTVKLLKDLSKLDYSLVEKRISKIVSLYRDKLNQEDESNSLNGIIREFFHETILDLSAIKQLHKLAKKNENEEIQYKTILLLGDMRRQYSLDTRKILSGLSKNPEVNVKIRAESARSLGKIKDGSSAELLTTLLQDESWKVRKSSLFALGEIGYKETIPKIIEKLRDDCEEVREETIKVLGRFGEKAKIAILKLTDILKDKNESERIRIKIVHFMIVVTACESIYVLSEIIRSKISVEFCIECINAITMLYSKDCKNATDIMPVLVDIHYKKNTDYRVKLSVRNALTILCDKIPLNECIETIRPKGFTRTEIFRTFAIIVSLTGVFVLSLFNLNNISHAGNKVVTVCIGIIGFSIAVGLVYLILKNRCEIRKSKKN